MHDFDHQTRRRFIQAGLTLTAASAAPFVSAMGIAQDQKPAAAQNRENPAPAAAGAAKDPKMKFDISFAAWSVHRAFQNGSLKQIDMPEFIRKNFDIRGFEMVNSFFASPQYSYLNELKKRAADNGVKLLLIMCDGEGDMSAADAAERKLAVRNHKKWVDIAAVLGCHSIRCNSGGDEKDRDSIKRCAESFAALVEYARPDNLNVIVENHGGISRNPDAFIEVVKLVNDPRFGTLPDFGNFPPEVDRYEAVKKWMPYAKAVSAKCHDFDEAGNETHTDYPRMMKIVTDAGYHSWLGIEYEGEKIGEVEGVKACKKLLERIRDAM